MPLCLGFRHGPRIAVILSTAVALTACAPGTLPRRDSPPTHQTGTSVHGVVGVGVNSERGPIATADLTLSVCRKPRPITLGVGVARREVNLQAQC